MRHITVSVEDEVYRRARIAAVNRVKITRSRGSGLIGAASNR